MSGAILSNTERVLALKTVPLLSELDTYTLRRLAQLLEEKWVPSGEPLTVEGEEVCQCHFVVRGEFDVTTGGERLARLSGPCSIGLMAIQACAAAPATVVSRGDVISLTAEADQVRSLWGSSFDFLSSAARRAAWDVFSARGSVPFDPAMPPTVVLRDAPRRPLDLVDKLALQANSPQFEKVNLEAVAELCRGQVEKRYAPGGVIWRMGDPATAALYVVAGVINVARHGVQLGRLGGDYTFGLFEALAGLDRSYDATAETEVVVLESNVTRLLEVQHDQFELATPLFAALMDAGNPALKVS